MKEGRKKLKELGMEKEFDKWKNEHKKKFFVGRKVIMTEKGNETYSYTKEGSIGYVMDPKDYKKYFAAEYNKELEVPIRWIKLTGGHRATQTGEFHVRKNTLRFLD